MARLRLLELTTVLDPFRPIVRLKVKRLYLSQTFLSVGKSFGFRLPHSLIDIFDPFSLLLGLTNALHARLEPFWARVEPCVGRARPVQPWLKRTLLKLLRLSHIARAFTLRKVRSLVVQSGRDSVKIPIQRRLQSWLERALRVLDSEKVLSHLLYVVLLALSVKVQHDETTVLRGQMLLDPLIL